MSLNAKLHRLSLDLRNVSQQPSPTSVSKNKSSTNKKSEEVADSWEDESLSESETKSPDSTSSVPVEAPGPDIKSPATRAIDAEKELVGELPSSIPPPPPTPISPLGNGAKADWTAATTLGGGRPTYKALSESSNSPRSTPPSYSGNITPTNRYPTPNPPVDSTARDRDRERDRDQQDRKRPEKTTATANRLIAGALGIKVPPKTEEQRRYERAVKEQEIKRRSKEKEERQRLQAEDDKAKAAVWDS